MGEISKKLISITTAVAVMSGLVFTSLPVSEARAMTSVAASTTQTYEDSMADSIKDKVETYSISKYGLTERTEEGAILHAFCWSFNSICANMKDIAEAGFSTVQTSPANPVNSFYTNMKLIGDKSDGTDGMWWWQKQPTDWKIGNYQLGTREEFKNMCAEAEKFGVKIIVEVNPNQTTANTNLVSQDLKNAAGGQDNLYHTNGFSDITQARDRYQCTTGMQGGLPDINTENEGFQEYYMNYVNDVIACGGDGFRYDNASYIGIPSDPKDINAKVNYFWPVATGKLDVNGVKLNNNENLFFCGDVLQGDDIPKVDYECFINTTASRYGEKLRGLIINKNFSVEVLKNWENTTPNNMLTMVESKDTYFNQDESSYINPWQTKMCWAVIAARAQGTPVFFSRPDGATEDNLAGKNVLGDKGDDMFKDPEVVAVNRFRNAMAGQSEELISLDGGKVLLIERGSRGVTIINLGGDREINSPTTLQSGCYTDHVSGATFTVSNRRLTGTIKGGRIAVLFKEEGPIESYFGASQSGGSFNGKSLELTLSAINVTSATYSVDGGQEIAYKDGQKIIIGANTINNGKIIITLSATGVEGKAQKSYTFTKIGETRNEGVYFKLPAGWDRPTCYVYDASVTPIKTNGAWPGVTMTDIGNGEYYYKIPEGFVNAGVMLASGIRQFPYAQQPGHPYTPGTALIFDGVNWTEEVIAKNPVMPVVTISPTGKHYVGETITINLAKIALPGLVECNYYDDYKFEVNSKLISDFSEKVSVNWIPTEPGTYEIKITGKDALGKTESAISTVKVENKESINLKITN